MNNEQFNQLMEEQKNQTEALRSISVSVGWLVAIIIIVILLFFLIVGARFSDVIMYVMCG